EVLFLNMSTLSHNKADDITLKDNTYEIKLPLKESVLNDCDEYFFTMEERETNQTLDLSCSISENDGDFTILILELPFYNHKQTFLDQDIWDLYLNRRKDDEIKRSRIKSDRDEYRFLSILLPEQDRMFYPYTTDKGKLSFRLNKYFLYSKIEKLSLRDNELDFSGLFNFPPLYKTNNYDINKLKVIVTVSEDTEEIEIPVERQKRKDLSDKYNGNEELLKCGFGGSFDFSRFLNAEGQLFFKFYLEMDYTYNG